MMLKSSLYLFDSSIFAGIEKKQVYPLDSPKGFLQDILVSNILSAMSANFSSNRQPSLNLWFLFSLEKEQEGRRRLQNSN